ncbi:hypothetical protein O8B93_25900 [Agrobacterium rhizogenes]|uniref:hypothetical protein n=1 Tax=Rhizobium rhizogenes TaxID=359 RepID=UPI0022B6E67D|nr:hypothetical protein [Rhizobium rhizogenes]MCZ7451007.1 hypothetical protein [Rhizobium rhizogenes]
MVDASGELARLVALYRHQHRAWIATAGPGEDLDADCPEFDLMEETGDRIICLPCQTKAEVGQKILTILEFQALQLSIKEDCADGRDLMRIFLLSLLCDA